MGPFLLPNRHMSWGAKRCVADVAGWGAGLARFLHRFHALGAGVAIGGVPTVSDFAQTTLQPSHTRDVF
ncbi:hypothetical protein ASD8599_01530 [Ascidiaceihabitans donghaensis]|uniref:Uncharacterized protein n=1 Tax=Ascidiaceihabitans donghaensis TaxID=1510460 RepID=A0A2R8BCL9_9RHOB|nr:hypothetical protein ASD8599_01530 [Ascidiaceihabitans donghaensis]